MELTSRIKEYACYSILFMVNFIFGIKYISRITEFYLPISIVLATLPISTIFFFKKTQKADYKFRYINLLIIACFIGFSIFLFHQISVESLIVDRWSIITSALQNFENGDYLYNARSNVDGKVGAMPFYFILAYPFYLTGELGYYSLLGIFGLYVTLKVSKLTNQTITANLLFLVLSLFFLWEVTCRSNIFLNATLITLAIGFLFKYKQMGTKHIIVSGAIFGLFLSTRFVLVIPFIITILYSLKLKRINIKLIFVIGLATLAAFTLTFLPFVWNHWNDMLTANPFTVQSTGLVPFPFTALFFFLAFIFAAFCKDETDVYFYSGLNLFICITIYMIVRSSIHGFNGAFWQSRADISYFIFCIPFLLLYLSKAYTLETHKS